MKPLYFALYENRSLPYVITHDSNFGFHHNRSIVEQLGYGPDSRLVIFYADDVGMCHGSNQAYFDLSAGIDFTHLDTHMGAAIARFFDG